MFNLIKQRSVAIIMNRLSIYFLISFIFGCVISYVFLANSAVHTLTVLEKTKQEMQTLGVEVSELESMRFVVDNKVDANLARKFGFVEVIKPIFIMKNSNKAILSLNN